MLAKRFTFGLADLSTRREASCPCRHCRQNPRAEIVSFDLVRIITRTKGETVICPEIVRRKSARRRDNLLNVLSC